MIMSMVNIVPEARSVLVVVIEPDNWKRMEQADPITMESVRAGGYLEVPMFPLNLSILIAYEADHEALLQAAGPRDFPALIKYLERGRVWDETKDGIQFVVPVTPPPAAPSGDEA